MSIFKTGDKVIYGKITATIISIYNGGNVLLYCDKDFEYCWSIIDMRIVPGNLRKFFLLTIREYFTTEIFHTIRSSRCFTTCALSSIEKVKSVLLPPSPLKSRYSSRHTMLQAAKKLFAQNKIEQAHKICSNIERIQISIENDNGV